MSVRLSLNTSKNRRPELDQTSNLRRNVMTRFGTSERKRCAAVMGLSATRADLRLAKKALAQLLENATKYSRATSRSPSQTS
jgi:hypothetical protein